MTEQQVKALLGLAQKAGKIVSGDDMVAAAMARKAVCFLLIAEDASLNSRDMVERKARKYAAPYRIWGTKSSLGLAIGKSPRSAVAVLDEHFAAGIKKLLMEEDFGHKK